MKIIKNAKVYDLGYGCYEDIAQLPSDPVCNVAGFRINPEVSLRMDKTTGEFYVYTAESRYSSNRRDFSIAPVTKAEAAKIAEDYLEYEQFVKFFGDPEGDLAAAQRKQKEAEDARASAEKDKDYWYKKYDENGKALSEANKKLEELKAEVEKLRQVAPLQP